MQFPDTEAALVHNLYPEPENFPKMIWNTNYQKLAAATIFTLFFAGKDYAPKCIVNGINVQDYLQQHYFKSIEQLAQKIHDSNLEDDVVIGYDTINEPGQGYLPFQDLSELLDHDTDFKMGLMPTPFQGMLLGSGIPTKVQHYEFKWNGPKKTGDRLVDPLNKTAWLNESELREACEVFGWKRDPQWSAGCIWETHGVWNKQSQQLLLPHYFATNPSTGEPSNFIDYWLEHIQNYASVIRHIHNKAILFVQPPVLEVPPKMPPNLDRLVYTAHWYDGLTLVKKKWCNYNIDFINLQRGKYGTGPLRFLRAFRYGEKAIRQCFVDQLNTIQSEGYENIGPYPCVIGEIGIPYDMEGGNDNTSPDKSRSFIYGLFSWFISLFKNQDKATSTTLQIQTPGSSQNRAMDANFNALEKNLLNYTLWHYMPDNSREWGDLWNGEDLSIWQQSSTEQQPSSTFYFNLEKASTTNSFGTTDSTLVSTPSSSDKKDVYATKPSNNSSTDSLANLLPQHSLNNRDLICLYRPHPYITAGIPDDIDFISPTEKIPASFKYTINCEFGYTKSTEIHVPSRFFPLSEDGTKITATAGEWKVKLTKENYWVLEWAIEENSGIDRAELKLVGVTV